MAWPPLPPRSPQRDLLMMSDPDRWDHWPFLPVVRGPSLENLECGVMIDARLYRVNGVRCTVFLTNLFLLPPTPDQFLALPREVFDTFEEVVAAGWRVD